MRYYRGSSSRHGKCEGASLFANFFKTNALVGIHHYVWVTNMLDVIRATPAQVSPEQVVAYEALAQRLSWQLQGSQLQRHACSIAVALPELEIYRSQSLSASISPNKSGPNWNLIVVALGSKPAIRTFSSPSRDPLPASGASC